MKELNRIRVGRFSIEQAVSLEQIDEMQGLKKAQKEAQESEEQEKAKAQKINVISIEEFFKDNPKIILEDYKLTLFLNGVKLSRTEKDRNIYYLSKTRQICGNRNYTKWIVKKGYCAKIRTLPTIAIKDCSFGLGKTCCFYKKSVVIIYNKYYTFF